MITGVYRFLMVWLMAALVTGASQQVRAGEKPANPDPWEPMNRRVFAFNEFMDGHLLKPVAKGYRAVAPQVIDDGVSNFFGNLEEIPIFVSHVLQFRLGYAGNGVGRFAVNSTLGLLGFFDVASKMGLEKHQTDLGETFGRWGARSGPYLMLPLLGPSTIRDGVGTAGDYFLHPLNQVDDEETYWSLRALDIVDTRADLLQVEDLITGDRYTFLRDLYLQRRQYQISGALPEDDMLDEEFLDEDFLGEEP